MMNLVEILYMTRLVVVLMMVIVKQSNGLTCYRTDEDTKELEEVENDSYVFCQYFPAHMNPKTNLLEEAVADGVTAEEAEDEKRPLDNFLNHDEPTYRVLSLCLYERYDFPQVWKQAGYSPKFHKTPRVEYQFRCICNYDRCNDPEKLKPYLSPSAPKKHGE